MENQRKRGVRKKIETVIFLVVYSEEHCVGAKDLLESIRVYCGRNEHEIILINTSPDPNVAKALDRTVEEYSGLSISLKREKCDNGRGEFYYLVSKYMSLALEQYDFKSFLKMDPDALITGFGLLDDINDYFKLNPQAGSLGSYKYNCRYERRDFRNWEPVFAAEEHLWRKYFDQMKDSNYVIGEHVQGGVEVYSYQCIQEFKKKNLLMVEEFKTSQVIVDVLLSFLVRFSGYEIHSFVDDGYPFAVAYQGMPLSISEIRRKNKKVIHSLKFTLKEMLLRKIFHFYRKHDESKCDVREKFPSLSLKVIS